MGKSESKAPAKPSATPSGSQGSNSAQAQCHTPCTISSETKAISPADRKRTKVGVGEEVKITVKGNAATWTISGGGKISPDSGTQTSVTFTAGESAGSTTVTAKGSGCSCSNSIAFTVVEPSDWTMKRQSGTNLKHTKGRPDCGWLGIMYVHPNDVNFYRIETREKDSKSVADGCYKTFNGVYHGNYPPPDQASSWFPITAHSETDGSTDNAPDQIYSGDPGSGATGKKPPFTVGTMYFPITIEWRVVGSATIKSFPIVRQEHEVTDLGKCESRKAHTESNMWNDETSSW